MAEIPLHYFRGRDGARLAYRELGAGRSGPDPRLSLHRHDPVPAGLRAHRGAWFRVILPDLRGHGASARPHDPGAYPPDVLADDGLALIGQLGLTGYDLGGYSLGGRTVIRMLARGATPGRAIVGGRGLEGISTPSGAAGGSVTSSPASAPSRPAPGTGDGRLDQGLRGRPGRAGPRARPRSPTHPVRNWPGSRIPTLVLTGTEDGHDTSAEALAARTRPTGSTPGCPAITPPPSPRRNSKRSMTGFLEGSSPDSPPR